MLVNQNYLRDPLDYRNFQSDPNESQLWHDIRLAAKSNKELQKVLDHAKLIYYLTLENDRKVDHHPV